jgi:hypothetical protein
MRGCPGLSAPEQTKFEQLNPAGRFMATLNVPEKPFTEAIDNAIGEVSPAKSAETAPGEAVTEKSPVMTNTETVAECEREPDVPSTVIE